MKNFVKSDIIIIMNGVLENFLKINRPINRLQFFKYTVCIILLQVILSVLLPFVIGRISFIWSFFIFPIILAIFVILPLLYLYFIQFSKRLWDITESSQIGIISSIIVFIAIVLSVSAFPVLAVSIYLTLILIPGKLVKNNV